MAFRMTVTKIKKCGYDVDLDPSNANSGILMVIAGELAQEL